MNKVKTRNLLILVHLFLAAFLAPSFLMVGTTGALKLAGVEPSIEDIDLVLPADTQLHKGHGPAIFKTYQMIAGISLFLVIVGGLVVGLLAKVYRRKTIVSLALGSMAFLALGFVV